MKEIKYLLILASIINVELENKKIFNYLHDSSITLKIKKKEIYMYIINPVVIHVVQCLIKYI